MVATLVLLAFCYLHLGAPLRTPPEQAEELPPKKVTGPEHRNCQRRSKSKSTIVGGSVVRSPDEFPFLAWIGDDDGTGMSQYCGGTLIDDRFVLTAGHCLYEQDWKNAKVYVRLHVANFATTPGFARSVVSYKRHPDYNSITMYEDLTILMLNDSVPVATVKLSNGTQGYERSGMKTILGWGSTDEQCSKYDALLRKSDVPMGPYGQNCQTLGSRVLTPAHDFDIDRQVCAGDYRRRKHYPGCGDSGGPLLAREGRDWVQVGIVSWSYGAPYPDVFTRVSKYRSWINDTMAELLQAHKTSDANATTVASSP